MDGTNGQSPARMEDAASLHTPGPQLLHAGTYALYRTPAGGLHVTFQRTSAPDETGQLRAIEGAPDEHLPELPPALVALLEAQQGGQAMTKLDMLKALAATMGGRAGRRPADLADMSDAELTALGRDVGEAGPDAV